MKRLTVYFLTPCYIISTRSNTCWTLSVYFSPSVRKWVVTGCYLFQSLLVAYHKQELKCNGDKALPHFWLDVAYIISSCLSCYVILCSVIIFYVMLYHTIYYSIRNSGLHCYCFAWFLLLLHWEVKLIVSGYSEGEQLLHTHTHARTRCSVWMSLRLGERRLLVAWGMATCNESIV